MQRWHYGLALLSLAVAFTGRHIQDTKGAEDRIEQLLHELADAPGPPGFEGPVRKIMVERMKPYADEVSFDGLGSVIASQGDSGPRVMVDAHMDEVGAMVRRVTPDGFLTMQMLGGWPREGLPGQRWTIIGAEGRVQAISGIRDAHLPAPAQQPIFLDVGAKSAEEARQMGIGPGDPIVPHAPFAVLNGTKNYVGKGWDDRAGCAVMIAAMRRLANAPHPNKIFYAATVQEEIGLRGARTASAVIKPDIGIGLESGICRDVPGVDPEHAQEDLGAGPGLMLYNNSQLPNRKFVKMAKRVATEKGIPLQLELVVGYGDDTAEIQKSNGGVPTILLLIPTRYTHAHNGIINRDDFDRLVDLLVAVLEQLDAKTVAEIREFGSEP